MNKRTFDILRCVAESKSQLTQRLIAEETKHSLGSVNAVLADVIQAGLITKDYQITEKGMDALAPFKVNNAIILAAGMSTRFVPVSYEVPKGLISVKGEPMIERQILQLQKAGIHNIVIVLGYMMEKFFYLREKYGVKIVVNNEYTTKNTHSSVYAARDYLSNTYILCSDNYYPKNMFHAYEYRAFYCSVFLPGTSHTERAFVCNEDGLVVDTHKPTHDEWIMYGHAYFDQTFTDAYKPILESYYGRPGIEYMYWETIYAENVGACKMWIQKCADDEILEFDSMEELKAFDPSYIEHNKIKIFENICQVLHCKLSDITDIVPVKKGLNNRSFKFTCRGEDYIYRHPGANASGIIDRKKEAASLKAAKAVGVDETLVYINEDEGWKISKFVTVTEEFDFSNKRHIQLLANQLKKLHQSNVQVNFTFDYRKEAQRLMDIERFVDALSFRRLETTKEKMQPIFEWLSAHEWQKSLCHNDIYEPNLLVCGDTLSLIDWEFAGDNDIGFDICKLFAVYNPPYDKIDEFLTYYYGRPTTEDEKIHLFACASVIYYYWYVWGIFASRNNSDVSEYLMTWFDKMNYYSDEILKRI